MVLMELKLGKFEVVYPVHGVPKEQNNLKTRTSSGEGVCVPAEI